ncbi:hypothetical protein ACWEFL_15875 [Streptomyces sp. NPDC004838]
MTTKTGPVPCDRCPARELLAEQWPDGTFAGTRHSNGRPRKPDPDAARHRADLDNALCPRRRP